MAVDDESRTLPSPSSTATTTTAVAAGIGGGGTGTATASATAGDSGTDAGAERLCCGGALLDTVVDFGECPDGDPWGPNEVHRFSAASEAMGRADLVVAWGTSLHIIANYFDPWDPQSTWKRDWVKRVRQESNRSTSSGASGASGGSAGEAQERAVPLRGASKPCRLAIVSVGEACDEDLAVLKIEADVDKVMAALLEELALPLPPDDYTLASDDFYLQTTPPSPEESASASGLFSLA